MSAGEWREEMLAKIPTKDLKLDAELDVGTRLRLSNGLEAVVHEKTDETITIDANPPLAGQTLQFDVELLHLTKVSLQLYIWLKKFSLPTQSLPTTANNDLQPILDPLPSKLHHNCR